MPLDYTGVGAARFEEPATLAWQKPWEVEDKTSLRVRIRAVLVSGESARIRAGFVCYNEAGTRVGEAFFIEETLEPSSSFIELISDNNTWPEGTAQAIQVMHLLDEGAIYEIDEFSVTDVTGITEAQSVRTLLSEDYFTREETNLAIAEATTTILSQVDDTQALILENYYTRADTDTAITQATTALKSEIEGEIDATLTNDYLTAVETDQAISSAQTTLQAKIDDVNGQIDQILNLDIGTDNALATSLQELQVELNGLESSVSTQSTALADLEGNLSAGLMFRVRADNSVSLFQLLAADGSRVNPTSIARIDADEILLNGTVRGKHFEANSITADKTNFGSLRALDITADTLDIIRDAISENVSAHKNDTNGHFGSDPKTYLAVGYSEHSSIRYDAYVFVTANADDVYVNIALDSSSNVSEEYKVQVNDAGGNAGLGSVFRVFTNLSGYHSFRVVGTRSPFADEPEIFNATIIVQIVKR